LAGHPARGDRRGPTGYFRLAALSQLRIAEIGQQFEFSIYGSEWNSLSCKLVKP
jgi:hypothetical protein